MILKHSLISLEIIGTSLKTPKDPSALNSNRNSPYRMHFVFQCLFREFSDRLTLPLVNDLLYYLPVWRKCRSFMSSLTFLSATYLSLQCNSTRLTFRTNSTRPWWMLCTTRFNSTTSVLQYCKLSSIF